MKLAAWLVPWVCCLALSGPARAAGAPDAWRADVMRIRTLAENDPTWAYQQAKSLQAGLPADAGPADRAQALNLLARAEIYLGLTDLAADHAAQAQAQAAAAGDRVGQAEAQLNIALNAINQAKIDNSIDASTRSLELLEGANRPDLLGEAMLRMATMYRRLGNLDSAVTMNMQAMEIAKRNKDPLALAYAHQGLAMSLDESQHYDEARAHFQQMREQARAAHSAMTEGYAIRGLAGVADMQGDIAGAERLMREVVDTFRALKTPFPLCHALFGLAELLRRQGRLAEATRLLDEVISIYERFPNKIGMWWTLSARSTNQQALHHLAAARADAQRAYAVAQDINFPLYKSESAKRMAAIYADAGDHKRAYQLSEEATAMANKAAQEQINTRIVELTQRYETESKQREINELTRRNEQQTAALRQQELQARWLWTLLVAVVVVLAGSMYFTLRLRRSQGMLMTLHAQVQQSERRLQATLNAVPDLLFELGLDGRYYDVHPQQSPLLIRPANELLGKTISDFMPPQAAEVCLAALREAHETGSSFGKQVKLDLPHGPYWFELSVARKGVTEGQEPRFIGLSRDITGRKAMEQELQASQDSLRQLAARNEEAREDERKHLTREIHDELGQYLLALRLGISVLDLQFGQDNARLQEQARRLIEMVDATTKVVRNVVTSLRPAALDAGFASALEWLVGEYSAKTGLQFALQVCQQGVQLDDRRATALFRIVQESLTNIVRHAMANKVEVSLERCDGNYRLTVRDNGRGFDPAVRKDKSFGLVGMRERALMLGGELDIASVPGNTTITVRIPVEMQNEIQADTGLSRP
jgi:PAS domain S-box-containing protein